MVLTAKLDKHSLENYDINIQLSSLVKKIKFSKEYNYLSKKEKTKVAVIEEKANSNLSNISMIDLGNANYKESKYDIAMKCYRRAASGGNSEALIRIGDMYLNGLGVTENSNKALEWYQEAADKDNKKAYVIVGNFYFYGESVDRDYDKSFKYFTKAAEAGDSDGMARLAMSYYYGYGTEPDKVISKEWMEKSAAKGNMYAEGFISKMYISENA
jgi:TPR repeat protein